MLPCVYVSGQPLVPGVPGFWTCFFSQNGSDWAQTALVGGVAFAVGAVAGTWVHPLARWQRDRPAVDVYLVLVGGADAHARGVWRCSALLRVTGRKNVISRELGRPARGPRFRVYVYSSAIGCRIHHTSTSWSVLRSYVGVAGHAPRRGASGWYVCRLPPALGWLCVVSHPGRVSAVDRRCWVVFAVSLHRAFDGLSEQWCGSASWLRGLRAMGERAVRCQACRRPARRCAEEVGALAPTGREGDWSLSRPLCFQSLCS